MDKTWKCLTHDALAELYCRGCQKYICAECLTTHADDGHKAQYVHIVNYAAESALPTLDYLLKEIGNADSEKNLDATELVSSLGKVMPAIKETINAHVQAVTLLKSLATQIEASTGPAKQQPFIERMRLGLTSDKKRLEQALKNKELQTLVTLTKKIEAEGKVTGGIDKDLALIAKAKEKVRTLVDLKNYQELSDILQLLAIKCHRLGLAHGQSDWKCDRKYLSSKMSLSEDGLTFGNTAGNGYPAIIGDVVFDSGLCVYEVVPTGLCCNGQEGFGMIEHEKYLAAHRADSSTPTVHDNIIGLLFGNVAKNMTVVAGSEMRMQEKYIVKADLISLEMTIKGPGCSLKAPLKADTAYVPCFSCGCQNNKLAIRPLEMADDD